MSGIVGYIYAIFRYPVKSMAGEELEEAFIGSAGVEGDRRYALLDVETGYLVSGKNIQHFSKVLHVKASLTNGILHIQLPNGENCSHIECDSQLSLYLGRKVRLVENIGKSMYYLGVEIGSTEEEGYHEKTGRTCEMTFHDSKPIHIVSLKELKELGLSHDDIVRFRPNVVVETPLNDDELIGRTIIIGNAQIKILKKTSRCIMITLPQQRLISNIELLKTLRTTRGGQFGLYAEVLKEGYIRKGDPIKFYPAEKKSR